MGSVAISKQHMVYRMDRRRDRARAQPRYSQEHPRELIDSQMFQHRDGIDTIKLCEFSLRNCFRKFPPNKTDVRILGFNRAKFNRAAISAVIGIDNRDLISKSRQQVGDPLITRANFKQTAAAGNRRKYRLENPRALHVLQVLIDGSKCRKPLDAINEVTHRGIAQHVWTGSCAIKATHALKIRVIAQIVKPDWRFQIVFTL